MKEKVIAYIKENNNGREISISLKAPSDTNNKISKLAVSPNTAALFKKIVGK